MKSFGILNCTVFVLKLIEFVGDLRQLYRVTMSGGEKLVITIIELVDYVRQNHKRDYSFFHAFDQGMGIGS